MSEGVRRGADSAGGDAKLLEWAANAFRPNRSMAEKRSLT